MHAIGRMAALPLAAFALACGGKSTPSASNGMDDGLRKDLELASSPSLELASTARAQQPQRVVSAIERTPGAAPARAVTKKKTPPKPAAPTRAPAVVDVQTPTEVPADEPVVVAQASAPQPEPQPEEEPAADPQEPTAAPRPEPPVVADPGPGIIIERRGGGGGLGGIIGVVIRGGGVDGDHCDPRGTVGRRRGGISINHRLPVHTTFPFPNGRFP